jgi:hypothetical protein
MPSANHLVAVTFANQLVGVTFRRPPALRKLHGFLNKLSKYIAMPLYQS